jgi:phage/plasmid-like protein (TIGR03299 family)
MYDMGFSVRETPWHGLGEVPDYYPGREEAMHLAGHDYTVREIPSPAITVPGVLSVTGEDTEMIIPDTKALLAVYDDGHQELLPLTVKTDFGIFQNSVAWDVVDALVDSVENMRYETALKLDDGTHSVLAYLDEPVEIPGDDSPIFPWVNVSWGHRPGMPLSARSTSIRTVCWNTQTAAEAQGTKYGTDYVFRHTKHVNDRIEEAKEAIRGTRFQNQVYVDIARKMADIRVTPEQRELFVSEIVPIRSEALLSERVMRNIETDRQKLRQVWNSPTMPEAHELTAYGMLLAGQEWFDHLMGARSQTTYFKRSMLKHVPAKAQLVKTINEVIAA